jgi:hypothetical protein
MTNVEITQKLNDMSDMIQIVDDTVKFHIGTMWTVVTVLIAILSTAGFFLLKNFVEKAVNVEIDKRLINLLKSNPPIFTASGSAKPDSNNKIFLNPNIQGIEQLEPEKVLVFEVRADQLIIANHDSGLLPVLRINEHGVVEIEIPNYHENNGYVHWNLLWPRKEYLPETK